MIRITITHVRDHPDGSTTETIVDEFAGSIRDLAARVAQCRAALHAPSTVDTTARVPTPEPAPANHAPVIVTTTPAPTAPWTGRTLFARAKTTPGLLRFIQDYGHEHGYPRTILQWSPTMCGQAMATWEAYQQEKGAVA